MENEKKILDTLIEITTYWKSDVDLKQLRLNDAVSTFAYDEVLSIRWNQMSDQNKSEVNHYQSCLDYLNKRLAEIDPNRPCEHYFAISYTMVSKRKRYYYYENCKFCGCEPLPTLRDLNK